MCPCVRHEDLRDDAGSEVNRNSDKSDDVFTRRFVLWDAVSGVDEDSTLVGAVGDDDADDAEDDAADDDGAGAAASSGAARFVPEVGARARSRSPGERDGRAARVGTDRRRHGGAHATQRQLSHAAAVRARGARVEQSRRGVCRASRGSFGCGFAVRQSSSPTRTPRSIDRSIRA